MKTPDGLSRKEAAKRLEQYGPNEIRDVSKVTPFSIFMRQIRGNFIVYLMFAAMMISIFVGKAVTAYVLLAVIAMVVLVGFLQEYHAEKAVSALRDMLVPVSIVIREGKEREVQSREIVPGDILVLRNGEKIPADCVLIEEIDLRMNESALTGEARDVSKKVPRGKKYSEENLVFMGTFIVNGKCYAKVLHTGMNTRFGKIARMISTTEKSLPLRGKVNKIAKYMAVVAVVFASMTGGLILFGSGEITMDVMVEVLVLAVAISVSAFPEGFPVVLITTLSNGARRMAKRNAIVNRLSIIETLGETTVICSDKTGTITRGEMTVRRAFVGNKFYDITGIGYEGKGEFLHEGKKTGMNAFKSLLENAVMCNDARIERTGEDSLYTTMGSPTESALLIFAAKAGLFMEDLDHERLREIPFNSERKMMTVACDVRERKMVYTKGAPEYVISKCEFIETPRGIKKMTEKDRKALMEANSVMTGKALRTLAFAYKKGHPKTGLEERLVFSGLVGMEDPPREEVKGAIRECKEAGIEVKMITGDNRETALAIANEIGLSGKIMEGDELEKITDEELAAIIPSIKIFARVKPEHKLRIVKALKARGEIVTMTGDGVNDAPALKEAHIGVAMGLNGTDVSRSVADLTLKDDNFGTIVFAISEGRTIFKNIRKFVTYQLSDNFTELYVLFFGVLLSPYLGWGIPLLLALQILFMNLVTDNMPAITLGLNPSSKDVMKVPPRRNAEILNKRLIMVMMFTSTIMMLFVLMSYYVSYNVLGFSVEYARTVALVTLIFLEVASAFNFRSFRKQVMGGNIFSNPYLVYASTASLFATMLVVYSPLNGIFETIPLARDSYLIPVGSAFALIVIFDVVKTLNNRWNFFDLEHI